MVFVQSRNLSKLGFSSNLISSHGFGQICLHGMENQFNILSGKKFSTDQILLEIKNTVKSL